MSDRMVQGQQTHAHKPIMGTRNFRTDCPGLPPSRILCEFGKGLALPGEVQMAFSRKTMRSRGAPAEGAEPVGHLHLDTIAAEFERNWTGRLARFDEDQNCWLAGIVKTRRDADAEDRRIFHERCNEFVLCSGSGCDLVGYRMDGW